MEKKKKEGNGDGREMIKIETVEVKKEIQSNTQKRGGEEAKERKERRQRMERGD